jgi:hypothetical protein
MTLTRGVAIFANASFLCLSSRTIENQWITS